MMSMSPMLSGLFVDHFLQSSFIDSPTDRSQLNPSLVRSPSSLLHSPHSKTLTDVMWIGMDRDETGLCGTS